MMMTAFGVKRQDRGWKKHIFKSGSGLSIWPEYRTIASPKYVHDVFLKASRGERGNQLWELRDEIFAGKEKECYGRMF